MTRRVNTVSVYKSCVCNCWFPKSQWQNCTCAL